VLDLDWDDGVGNGVPQPPKPIARRRADVGILAQQMSSAMVKSQANASQRVSNCSQRT
jgi:hypothetical protein